VIDTPHQIHLILNALANKINKINEANGFNDDKVDDDFVKGLLIDRRLLLTVGEIIEAQEELRSGREVYEVYYTKDKNGNDKPEGFGPELADALIRLLHLCGALKLDIGGLVTQKLAYNETRGYKHGRSF
jgi:NTP pyrophosphatase (non-canonical NTP hydrolase)